MKSRIALSSICLGLCACSQANLIPESRIGSAGGVRCQMMVPTGSIRPQKVCTTPSQRDSQNSQAQAALEDRINQQRNEALRERASRSR
jgi:hypothetical protein